MSIFFIVISFISVTLSWFAYSGLSKVSTEIGVKAWYIELEKDGQKVTNDIVINLQEIYPGMDIVNEAVSIKNLGDSDAKVSYSIVSARVLGNDKDNYNIDDTTTTEYVEDAISHDYPFHINMNLSRGYVLSKGEDSTFRVSISWPLDSDSNALDSVWGTNAYNFHSEENTKKNNDSNYQVRPAIQIVISVSAEQYIDDNNSSDIGFNLGAQVLYNPYTNQKCDAVSSTCLRTNILDIDNKNSDTKVTLLPNSNIDFSSSSFTEYQNTLNATTSAWTVETRNLLVDDVAKIISLDVTDSLLVRNNISDAIIGNLKYQSRASTELSKAINYNGYYKYLNNSFSFLTSSSCYWTASQFNETKGFAVTTLDEEHSKLYGENKATSCKVIPVMLVDKEKIQ